MESVRDYIHYNPETGELTWIKSPNARVKVGDKIKSIDAYGYLSVSFRSKVWKAHRLAWFLYYDQLPDKDIDHINGDRVDNRISNLRSATRGQNLQNMQVSGKGLSNYKGVSRSKTSWTAQITVNNKKLHLGSFKTEEEAALAYNNEAEKRYGDFACLNKVS